MSSGVSVYPGTIPGSWGTRMSWVVSVNRQVAGVGFQKDPDLTSEGMTSAEEQALTRISREFNQLSVGMAAQPEALYSTTFVFDDKTGRWGIVVVGSGGEYGETGAIQTALAPDGMPLAEVASRMLGVLSDNLLLSPSARIGSTDCAGLDLRCGSGCAGAEPCHRAEHEQGAPLHAARCAESEGRVGAYCTHKHGSRAPGSPCALVHCLPR